MERLSIDANGVPAEGCGAGCCSGSYKAMALGSIPNFRTISTMLNPNFVVHFHKVLT